MVEQSFFLLGSFPYIKSMNNRIFDAYVKLEKYSNKKFGIEFKHINKYYNNYLYYQK